MYAAGIQQINSKSLKQKRELLSCKCGGAAAATKRKLHKLVRMDDESIRGSK